MPVFFRVALWKRGDQESKMTAGHAAHFSAGRVAESLTTKRVRKIGKIYRFVSSHTRNLPHTAAAALAHYTVKRRTACETETGIIDSSEPARETQRVIHPSSLSSPVSLCSLSRRGWVMEGERFLGLTSLDL